MIAYLADREQRAPAPVRDAGVAIVWLAFGLLLAWALPEARIHWWGADTGPGTASIAVLVLACAGATVRRSAAPLGLLVTTAALLLGPLTDGRTEVGTVLVFTDLLYCAVLYTSRRTSRAVAVGSAVATAVLTLVSLLLSGTRPTVYNALNLALVVGIPLVWGLEVRRHRDIATAERARAAAAEHAAARERDAAVAAERARMARDLHDVVAGRLSAIALQSEAALQPGADDELVRRVLGTVRESGVAALGEMRTMIGLLRDGSDPPGAPARLAELAALLEEARATGLDVTLRDDRGTAPLPAPVDLAGYRIVQESLTNAAKHAPASRVTVHLGPGPGPGRTAHHGSGDAPGSHGARHAAGLVIEVRNGPGRRAAEGPGLHGGTGLDGLRERATAVGGTLDAGPDGSPDRGWLVRAVLPLDPEGPVA
ncbi:sensor histidine kinase [Pseudonocardia sp. HH130630-07]|uniref:sensor histidine kinase n=1 Tax=Pseudonocardia sp. HH130630-07 TaxID=1690815 RepID=UPI0008152763|nr:histidine kinase [Pseudonocardia sp. HH130630-07]ANY07159.1 hypothetical protein AFB00_13695 [Pseudonocardia sp. HH130630-07]